MDLSILILNFNNDKNEKLWTNFLPLCLGVVAGPKGKRGTTKFCFSGQEKRTHTTIQVYTLKRRALRLKNQFSVATVKCPTQHNLIRKQTQQQQGHQPQNQKWRCNQQKSPKENSPNQHTSTTMCEETDKASSSRGSRLDGAVYPQGTCTNKFRQRNIPRNQIVQFGYQESIINNLCNNQASNEKFDTYLSFLFFTLLLPNFGGVGPLSQLVIAGPIIGALVAISMADSSNTTGPPDRLEDALV